MPRLQNLSKVLLYPYIAVIALESLTYLADPSLLKWRAEIVAGIAAVFSLPCLIVMRAPDWLFGLSILIFGVGSFAIAAGSPPIRWGAVVLAGFWPIAIVAIAQWRIIRNDVLGSPP